MPRTYTTLVSDVVTKTRIITNDLTQTYRASDAEIIGWLNDCLSTVVAILPQLFVVEGTHTCVAGARQTLANDRAHSLVEVSGVPYADYAAMSAFMPTWKTVASGTIQNWLRSTTEPLDFFTYPQQAGGEVLPILYVESPVKLTLTTDVIPLPETYEPALVAYCVGMVESKDDQHVNSGRAAQHMTDFAARIKGG